MSEQKKQLISSIVKFINDEVQSASLNDDQRESLQVAKECFATAYGITSDDEATAQNLLTLFSSAAKSSESGKSSAPSSNRTAADATIPSEQRAEAEKLKQIGNDAMMGGRFEDAEKAYTSAIALDGHNAVYYANRAAARAKMGNRHADVVADCERALEIDGNYAKAHYRLGCAHSQAGEFDRAITSLKRAVELDSANDAYRAAFEEALAHAAGASAPNLGAGAGPFGQMGDFASLLNNPALVQTAMQLFQNPDMRQMMTNMASQIHPGGVEEAMGGVGGGPGGAGGPSAGLPDMSNLMRVGQQMAAAMQQQNPDLVEQLRRQFQQGRGPNDSNPSS